MSDHYVSPLTSKYATKEMISLFSSQSKYRLWRELWTKLAIVQKNAGLPITDRQIQTLEKYIDQISFEEVARYEDKTHHEVMAHILAFGDQAKQAAGVIHLGCTSSFVMDNGDLIQIKKGGSLLIKKMRRLLQLLAGFCDQYKELPCVGYTHFQPAQPTTIGKRASLWLQDLLYDYKALQDFIPALPFLGLKGATGSQFTYLELFDGDEEKLLHAEQQLAKDFGFTTIIPIASQTYMRKLDLSLLNLFQGFAVSMHKMATDIRLLSHTKEVCEGFEKEQIGSSAMPYKQNPIYSERICSLARLLISFAQNPAYTAALQWLERSLDDSANRRMILPESFLLMDSLIELSIKVISSLKVNPEIIEENIKQNLPKFAMEALLTFGIKKGVDRQMLHKQLQENSDATLSSLAKQLNLSENDLKKCYDIQYLTGRSSKQVTAFLDRFVWTSLKNA